MTLIWFVQQKSQHLTVQLTWGLEPHPVNDMIVQSVQFTDLPRLQVDFGMESCSSLNNDSDTAENNNAMCLLDADI